MKQEFNIRYYSNAMPRIGCRQLPQVKAMLESKQNRPGRDVVPKKSRPEGRLSRC
jgi:hypothetical protein